MKGVVWRHALFAIASVLAVISLNGIAFASTCQTVPKAFTPGQPAVASDVNANFNNVYQCTNLLGTAANQNTGTSGPAVPLLNAANTWSASQTVSFSGTVALNITTSSTTGLAQNLLTADDGHYLALTSYGSSAAGTIFGFGAADNSFVGGGSGRALFIGNLGAGGVFFGTGNTLGMVMSGADQGVYLDGTSGSKGHGTINTQGLYATNLTSCSAGITNNSSGQIVCSSSDARLKNIREPFTIGLSAVEKIVPQTYAWKKGTPMYDGGIRYSGFIAQNVEDAIPQAVGKSDEGTLQVNTTTVLAAAINAIKELSARDKVLTALNADLLTKNDELRARFVDDERRLAALESKLGLRMANANRADAHVAAAQ